MQAPCTTTASEDHLCMMLTCSERLSHWRTMVRWDWQRLSEDQHDYRHGQQICVVYDRTSTFPTHALACPSVSQEAAKEVPDPHIFSRWISTERWSEVSQELTEAASEECVLTQVRKACYCVPGPTSVNTTHHGLQKADQVSEFSLQLSYPQLPTAPYRHTTGSAVMLWCPAVQFWQMWLCQFTEVNSKWYFFFLH